MLAQILLMWLKWKEYESWACKRQSLNYVFRNGQVKELAGRRKHSIQVIVSDIAFKNGVLIPLRPDKSQTLKYIRRPKIFNLLSRLISLIN
jgi:hypothetical protein